MPTTSYQTKAVRLQTKFVVCYILRRGALTSKASIDIIFALGRGFLGHTAHGLIIVAVQVRVASALKQASWTAVYHCFSL